MVDYYTGISSHTVYRLDHQVDGIVTAIEVRHEVKYRCIDSIHENVIVARERLIIEPSTSFLSRQPIRERTASNDRLALKNIQASLCAFSKGTYITQ